MWGSVVIGAERGLRVAWGLGARSLSPVAGFSLENGFYTPVHECFAIAHTSTITSPSRAQCILMHACIYQDATHLELLNAPKEESRAARGSCEEASVI